MIPNPIMCRNMILNPQSQSQSQSHSRSQQIVFNLQVEVIGSLHAIRS